MRRQDELEFERIVAWLDHLFESADSLLELDDLFLSLGVCRVVVALAVLYTLNFDVQIACEERLGSSNIHFSHDPISWVVNWLIRLNKEKSLIENCFIIDLIQRNL